MRIRRYIIDKGIRPETIRKFRELLPTRENTRAGNTVFRKTVMAHIMENFGITLASAATHYNHAFIDAKELAKTDATIAAQLEGLGRPEDKKGGRKPKPVAPAVTAPSVIPTPNLLQNMLAAIPVISTAAALVGIEGMQEEAVQDETQVEEPAAEEEAPVQKYSVCKSSTKEVVCSDLTLEEAEALIAKAAAAKKAKLELVA
jgi:hypothetical protein